MKEILSARKFMQELQTAQNVTPSQPDNQPAESLVGRPIVGPAGKDRVRLSAWGVLRADVTQPSAAPLGQLGGSQIGFRIVVPLDGVSRNLALSLRASASPDLKAGREIAPGLALQPKVGMPLEIITEARIAAHRDGGIRPALLLAGGLYDAAIAPDLWAEGYGQAGVIGYPNTAIFADGRLTLTRTLAGPIRSGVGLWGGRQPGLARLDVGPALILPMRSARLTAEWRVRIAGNARPSSGPSVTLGRDF